MTDILLRLVAEQFRFGLVGPEYLRVGVHLMDPFGGVFKEIRKFALSAQEGLFDLLAPGDLGLERASLLLQQGDGPKPLILAGLPAVTLGGGYAGVRFANVNEGLAVSFATEAAQRIGAEKRETMFFAQFVPELFQTDVWTPSVLK